VRAALTPALQSVGEEKTCLRQAAAARREARGQGCQGVPEAGADCRRDNQAHPLPRVLLRARTPPCADPRVVYARDQQHTPLHVTRDVVVVLVVESGGVLLPSFKWYARMCMWIYAAILTLRVIDPALHALDTALHAQRLGSHALRQTPSYVVDLPHRA
jgi:hypothetical protein